MKKLLICIMIILICILTLLTVLKGLHLGNFNILGIQEIKEADIVLEQKLQSATKLVNTDYPKEISTLNNDVKAMQTEKQTYEDMISVSAESEIAASIQKQKYTVDKLWAKLGTLATDEGLDAKFELTNGTLTATASEDYQYYNINFTVSGSYVGISLYISNLEDDTELGFKIENFSMMPEEDGKIVKATFTTKDIAIKGISSTNVMGESQMYIQEDTTQNASNNTTNKSILNSINSTVTNSTTTRDTNSNNMTTDTVGR